MAALSGCDRDVPLTDWGRPVSADASSADASSADAASADLGSADATTADAPRATYKGAVLRTAPTAFGGTPYCNYTITLQELEIELELPSAGTVAAGRVQDLNVEATEDNCPNGVKPISVARYTLRSAVANGNGMRLAFDGDSGNDPAASLVVDLSPDATAYSAVLTFHRTDFGAPLDWWVVTTLPLYPPF